MAVPQITGIAPNPAVDGSLVTITGLNFGVDQGAARFVDAVNDPYQLDIVSWNDTTVVISGGWPKPFAPETGQVSVFEAVDNFQSNAVSLTVTPAPPVPPPPPPITWTGNTASVQGDALRITQLDQNGAPTAETYTIAGFISFKMVPTYGGGDLAGSRSANGLPGRRIRLPLLVTKVALELVICSPSIRTMYELQGGKLKITNNYGSGYAAPLSDTIPCRNVAIEVWSKGVDSNGQQIGYYRWLLPYVNMSFTGDTTVDSESAVAPVFTGWSRANAGFGAGSDGFWVDQLGRAYQFAWDGVLPPIDDATQASPPTPPPPPPPATFSDNFNRTNRQLTGDSGWIGLGSSVMSIVGDRVDLTTEDSLISYGSNVGGAAVVRTATLDADGSYHASLDFVADTNGDGGYLQLLVICDAAAQAGIYLNLSAYGSYEVDENWYVGGVLTGAALASGVTVAVNDTPGVIVNYKLVYNPTIGAVTFTANGAVVASVTATRTHTAETYCGFGWNYGGPAQVFHADNWNVA